jgi:hypothetical protein
MNPQKLLRLFPEGQAKPTGYFRFHAPVPFQ